MSALNRLLDRLEGVKQTAPSRWVARCPSHDDSSPSLSIREADDRILLHDFGGCDVLAVVHSLGLEMVDLFEKPLANDLRRTRARIPAADRLEIIYHESLTIGLIVGGFMETKTVEEQDWERLALAISRIAKVRNHG